MMALSASPGETGRACESQLMVLEATVTWQVIVCWASGDCRPVVVVGPLPSLHAAANMGDSATIQNRRIIRPLPWGTGVHRRPTCPSLRIWCTVTNNESQRGDIVLANVLTQWFY